MGMTNIMIKNFWKNKLEKKDNLEELQNLYEDEVMKYKSSKAKSKHFYSTMFEPVTEKLEETIEPLKRLKELSEEQSKVMLPAPVAPLPIDAPPEEEEEEEGEYEEWEEEEEEEYEEGEEGAVGGVEETKSLGYVIDVDKGLDIERLRDRDFRPPSEYIGKSDEDLKKVIREIGMSKSAITKEISKLKGGIKDLNARRKETDERREKTKIKNRITKAKSTIKDLETDYENLDKTKVALQGLKGHSKYIKGKGLYKIKQNGQYGSSYINIPLLKKRKILEVVDGYGNPLLKGNISKDSIDLITKRFNSKKKYKGSSIEAFKLLNKLSSTPINKRSKKIACTPTFYGNPRDLLEHLDLILGSIEAGNNNLRNEGIAVLDELLKIGAIKRGDHERVYKKFFT